MITKGAAEDAPDVDVDAAVVEVAAEGDDGSSSDANRSRGWGPAISQKESP